MRNARHVTIDDLGECELTLVGHEVEALRLNTRRVQRHPFQIVSGELGKGGFLGLFGDRSNGRGPVDGLLGTGDVGQPGADKIRLVRGQEVEVGSVTLTAAAPI